MKCRSFWKLCRLLFGLLFGLCLASLCSASNLEDRVADLESRVNTMELKLELFGDDPAPSSLPSLLGAEDGAEPGPARKIRSKEELEKALKIDATGESQRKDKPANFPEISTFVAWTNGRRDLINGLGVELFHDRDKPRRHNWMFKLLLADQWVGFSAGYILVPVINFNIGPFIAKDLEEDPITRDKETVWGIQASVFSF